MQMDENNHRYRLYVFFDDAAKEPSQIFEAKNDQVALRSYRNLLKNVDEITKPDYRLLCVGEIDKTTLELISYLEEIPTTGIQLVPMEDQITQLKGAKA